MEVAAVAALSTIAYMLFGEDEDDEVKPKRKKSKVKLPESPKDSKSTSTEPEVVHSVEPSPVSAPESRETVEESTPVESESPQLADLASSKVDPA